MQPGETFKLGPFSIMPILANHGDDSPSGSVIYIVKMLDRKIIIGWDFLSLPNTDQNLFWKPDLLILGTESYNPHPSTGMISVTEAYDLVRRWNAKECYIVHYSGLKDFEEARNQWFRGPIKAMTTDDLQNMIKAHLRVTDNSGKFKITVAKEGMVWTAQELTPLSKHEESTPIGETLEIESLNQYILQIEKVSNIGADDKLKLSIEDRINRSFFEFIKPRKDIDGSVLQAEPMKSMMMKGPELKMNIIPHLQESSLVRINIVKGRKAVFQDDIIISIRDSQRLRRYIKENFPSDQLV
jgi:hypothetical protein